MKFLSAFVMLAFFLSLPMGCRPPAVMPKPKTTGEDAPNLPRIKSYTFGPQGGDPPSDTGLDLEDDFDRDPVPRAKPFKPDASDPGGASFNDNAKFTPTYRLLSWNVESEGADSEVIADQLAALNANDQYDVVALTEVLAEDFNRFQTALGKQYKYAYSKSGRNDRLELLYNEDRFELIRFLELDEINLMQRYRAPLVVHLKDRTSSQELMVMVNHLARGREEVRQEQATKLVEWARDQTLPVFALGDYNFDYVFETRQGNPGFVNMMRDNIWKWIEPAELIDTNWYDNPQEPDGQDDYPGSMLDFAFVAGPAKEWKATCHVIVREGDFPDDEKTSDHRPFELLIAK